MMRKGMRDFWRKKQYMIAAIVMVIAAAGITGLYAVRQSQQKKEEQQAQIAKEEQLKEEKEKEQLAKRQEEIREIKETAQKEKEEAEETKSVSVVVPPEGENTEASEEDAPASANASSDSVNSQETKQTSAKAELHFDAETGLLWPLSGSVLMNYSMDQTVYFATLDQYKYNPAVIISGNVNDKVQAAADGKIVDVSTNEETGCTITMDLGDGYSAVYGQLKEVPFNAGAYVEAGDTIGYVSEPTKYYSVEGSNLFFELKKDDVPVNPVEFFQ